MSVTIGTAVNEDKLVPMSSPLQISSSLILFVWPGYDFKPFEFLYKSRSLSLLGKRESLKLGLPSCLFPGPG